MSSVFWEKRLFNVLFSCVNFFLCKLGPFILRKRTCGLVTMTPGSPALGQATKKPGQSRVFSGC